MRPEQSGTRAGERVQQLGVHTALRDDLSSVLSTHVSQLTRDWNPAPGDLTPLVSGLQGHLPSHVHIHTHN